MQEKDIKDSDEIVAGPSFENYVEHLSPKTVAAESKDLECNEQISAKLDRISAEVCADPDTTTDATESKEPDASDQRLVEPAQESVNSHRGTHNPTHDFQKASSIVAESKLAKGGDTRVAEADQHSADSHAEGEDAIYSSPNHDPQRVRLWPDSSI